MTTPRGEKRPMTRAERLAQAQARTQARIVADRARLAKLKAQDRDEAEKARRKRIYRVGLMADAVGVLAWDDSTIQALLAALVTLKACPNPVAVLHGLLCDGAASTTGGTGEAETASRVTPAVSVGLMVK